MMSTRFHSVATMLFLVLPMSAFGFVTPATLSPSCRRDCSVSLYRDYDAERWQQHKSAKRYVSAFSSTGLATNFGAVVTVAVTVASLDLLGLAKLRISAVPLVATSPLLALLLVARMNAAYARWWEARTIWSQIKNRVRDLNRQGNSYWKSGGDRFAGLAVAFAYSLKSHLRGGAEPEELQSNLTAVVGRTQSEAIMREEHRPHAVTKAMTKALGLARLSPQLQARVDQGISDLLDHVGNCERILNTPIPRAYSFFTAKALSAWMLFLPSALLGVGYGFWQVVLGTTMTAALLLGIDQVGRQIENPFSVLPLDEVCRGLRGEFERIVLDSKQQNTKDLRLLLKGKKTGGGDDESYFPTLYDKPVDTRPSYLTH